LSWDIKHKKRIKRKEYIPRGGNLKEQDLQVRVRKAEWLSVKLQSVSVLHSQKCTIQITS
jgi:hypothetical protein